MLDVIVSLSPLTTSIQEFALAAKEAERESQVKIGEKLFEFYTRYGLSNS